MTAIEFNNISKQYRLGLVSTSTISHDLNRWWQTAILHREDPYLKIGETNDRTRKGTTDYVWALRDIDFKVDQGDVFGIIGSNGSGKSTLLKILSRVTTPTTGTIRARGRIASLLEVGTGFHQEMTGRENIFMNGTILGMTKHEVASKLDEIVDFAGVERYLDTPVKRYSSGMVVRLGFAIAAHLEPEILVVDEVLAVGDAAFQSKAISKMEDVSRGEGRTILFVSHNLTSVQRICNKGVLLENGSVGYIGSITDTISKYQTQKKAQNSFVEGEGDRDVIFIEQAKVYPHSGDVIYNGSEIIIEISISVGQRIMLPVVGLNVYSMYGHPLARADFNDRTGNQELKPGNYTFRFKIPSFRLSVGDYRVAFTAGVRYVKNYATQKSDIYFSVAPDPSGFGSAVFDNNIIKSSIIRADWFEDVIVNAN